MGAAITVAAAALLGRHYANRGIKHIDDLISVKKALLVLSSEIEYMRTPLPAAAASIARRVEGIGGQLFASFANFLTGETTAYTAWGNALTASKSNMTAQDIAALDEFGKTLGYLDTKMQLNNITHTLTYLNERTQSLQANADKNARMYKSLGVLGGLIMTVVLW
jgi:stage III sporulation protein AB